MSIFLNNVTCFSIQIKEIHNNITMATTCTIDNDGKNLLPKLPLPNINETMEKYLDSVAAYISPNDYERTKTHVKAFLSNEEDLKKIDEFLAKRNMETQNWVILLFQNE